MVFTIIFLFTILSIVYCKENHIISRSEFLVPLDYKNVKLSYDGKWIAYVGLYEWTPNIFVKNLPDGTPKLLSNDTKRGINSFSLAYDNKSILYEQDNNGDENYNLYTINVESGETKVVSKMPGVRNKIIATSYKRPYEIIVGRNKRDPIYDDAYLIDLRTGEETLVYENHYFRNLLFDPDLRLRIGSNETSAASVTFYYFKDDGDIELLREATATDQFASKAIYINSLGIIYWTDNENVDKAGLVSLDPRTKQKQVVYTAKKADVWKAYFHAPIGRPLWLYEYYAKPEMILLDLSYESDFKKIHNLTSPRSYNNIELSLDGNKWLIEVISDNKPALYYIYDRSNEQQPVEFLFSAKDKWLNSTFSPTYFYDITTSDGLVEMCYLNFPAELDNGYGKPVRPMPTILLVHGGPNSRDDWEFNNQYPTQFYASRDYAVLRCNFRASIGYGKALVNAGNGEWGRKMQQDLTDAVKWSIAMNITDPSKVAILGGSYGGYATLAGVTFTPDLYVCAVALAAPSDLVTDVQMIPNFDKPHLPVLHLQMSNDSTTYGSEEYLKSRSPFFFVDKIKTPLLIVQGDVDPRVNKIQTIKIVEALKNTTVPVIFLRFPDEGHLTFRPANLLATMALAEDFFAKCLGGTSEPMNDELEKSSGYVVSYNVANRTLTF